MSSLSAVRDVVDPRNERIVGTLQPKAWAGFCLEEANAIWDDVDWTNAAEIDDAYRLVEKLIQSARHSSMALRGEGRREYLEATKGQPALAVGYASGQAPQQPTQVGPQKGF